MSILLGAPVTERGVSRLARKLELIARRYNSIALPLPQSICVKIIMDSVKGLDYALNVMKQSNLRIWGNLLLTLRDIIVENPDVNVACYASESTYINSEARGLAIATLVVKAKAYNVIDVDEWLRVFETMEPRELLERVLGYDVVVSDGYSWTLMLENLMKPSKVIPVDILAPTPLDILELINLGYVDRVYAREVIEYAVKYIGEYIVTSYNLTQAYDKLLRDEGYLGLLERLKLKIYKVKVGGRARRGGDQRSISSSPLGVEKIHHGD